MLLIRTRLSKLFAALVVAILLASMASSRTSLLNDSEAGTIIINRAEATYSGDNGVTYSTVIVIVSDSVLYVTPLSPL